MSKERHQEIFDALLAMSDSLAESWLEAIKADREIPSSEEVSELRLMDSIPDVLEQVIALAAGDVDTFKTDHLKFAQEHGRERSSSDFDPRELVREYQVLRQEIFRALKTVVAENEISAGRAVDVGRKLGTSLDAALRETIGAFVEQETEDLVEASRRDGLTGLLNHRSFYDELNRELRAAGRTGRPLSVAIFDLDRFKDVNDQLGHRAGDKVLTAWAEKLTARFRESDIVSRYGGDEFAAILPGADRKSAETLLEGLAMEPVKIADVLDGEDAAGFPRSVIRASWGVAESPPDGTTVAELIETADRRLFKLKRRRHA